jgi:hypothetical protein
MSMPSQKSTGYSLTWAVLILAILGTADTRSDERLIHDQHSVLADSYFGQTRPGMTAELFAPGIVSTDASEHFGPTVSPDNNLVVWSYFRRLMISRRNGRKWTDPEPLLIGDDPRLDGPHFAPDKPRLYFYAARSADAEDEDLWYVDSTPTGWAEPVNLGTPINTEQSEVFPAVEANGTLYFSTLGPPRVMYRSRRDSDGNYEEPVRLPDSINEDLFYSQSYVAPDGSYMIFSSTRSGGHGSADLYMSRRVSDFEWGTPFNLGPAINTTLAERSPFVTPDGDYLLFMRHRCGEDGRGCGSGDAYWASAKLNAVQ